SPRGIGNRDATELIAVNAGDAVVPRQPFVDERVIRRQKIEDAAVFADDAREQQFGLMPHRLTEVVVKVRESLRIANDVFEVSQIEPLAGKVLDERVRLGVREQPAHLRRSHQRIAQATSLREAEEPVVGNAVPEKERQARSERDVDVVATLPVGVQTLDPEDELRADEETLERCLDAAVEVAVLSTRREEGQQRLEVAVGHGTAVRPLRERRQDALRASAFPCPPVRTADEDAASALRRAAARCVERTGDAYGRQL